MMKKTRIDNALVWTQGALQAVSILIEDGKILRLPPHHEAEAAPADEVIEASGQWILPGGVDAHVHISDGAEVFSQGSRCAAAGGITTVLDMAPFHGCVTPEQFTSKTAAAEKTCVVDFGLIAGIVVTTEDLHHLGALAQMGAASFKVFMPGQPPVTPKVLWESVQAAAHTGLRMVIHAEEPGCLQEVDWDDPLGFPHARPIVAESSATAQVLEMARAAGAPVHICHVSAGDTADLIAHAKALGVDVTAETPAHFLLLDETAFLHQGARVKTTPPLRPRVHQDRLWEALREGVIDMLACDHFLGTREAVPTDPALLKDAAAGIASLELSLPLVFSAGLRAGRLSLGQFVRITARCPAEVFGLGDRKGAIEPGLDADLVFWDPEASWRVAPTGAFSRNANSPYLAWDLAGRITRTILRGATVWEGAEIKVQDGFGQLAASVYPQQEAAVL
jgi:allantoinase